MSDFLKRFLLEEPPRSSPGGRYVALAAFGKHPGWDDHVEDLGLETESLNIAKTVLYVNGIGGQIDAAAWEKLEPAKQLPSFKHVFVWQRSGQVLVGRMWSSSDGKGRKRYPMVVCVHFFGVTLAWALKYALPVLAELEEGCVQTNSAEEVRSLLNRKRSVLREAIQSTDRRGEYAPVSPETLNQIMRPAGESKTDGFLRVLYQIQGQLGAFAAGAFNARANAAAVHAQQVRVPVSNASTEQALLFWTRFFLTHVDNGVPLLLTLPLDEGWLDVTVGEPESHEFFCLRATPKAMPLVSEVPYTFSEEFRTQGTAFLEGFLQGETTSPNLAVAAAPPSEMATASKGGWKKWLGIGAVLVAAAVAAGLIFLKPPKTQNAAAPSDTKSALAQSTTNDAAAAAARDKARAETAAAAAEQKKQADALAAAAKLKADTETAAKAEEAARVEREKEAARVQAAALLEAQRKAEAEAAAKKKAEDEARAKAQAQATAPTVTTTNTPRVAPATTPQNPASGFEEMTNGIGMVLVHLPDLKMWVGKYEVTQAEYQKIAGSNPSKSQNGLQPVEMVNWHDATNFAGKLTESERTRIPAGMVYSLPTEKQWKAFSADQKIGDLPAGATSRTGPSAVGQNGPPNKLGLFDVVGNVFEWCLDDAPGGAKRLKGGAYNSPSETMDLGPDTKSARCGFRLVLVGRE
jgi:formylglycine-generating enzyme required for sulfatase activity